MTVRVCQRCPGRFAVTAPHCPQCGNCDYLEQPDRVRRVLPVREVPAVVVDVPPAEQVQPAAQMFAAAEVSQPARRGGRRQKTEA